MATVVPAADAPWIHPLVSCLHLAPRRRGHLRFEAPRGKDRSSMTVRAEGSVACGDERGITGVVAVEGDARGVDVRRNGGAHATPAGVIESPRLRHQLRRFGLWLLDRSRRLLPIKFHGHVLWQAWRDGVEAENGTGVATDRRPWRAPGLYQGWDQPACPRRSSSQVQLRERNRTKTAKDLRCRRSAFSNSRRTARASRMKRSTSLL